MRAGSLGGLKPSAPVWRRPLPQRMLALLAWCRDGDGRMEQRAVEIGGERGKGGGGTRECE